MTKATFITALFFIPYIFISTKLSAQTVSSSSQLLHHVLIVTFKKEASPDSIKAVNIALTKLAKIPVVKGYEWGTDITKSKNKQLKHFYVISFAKQEDIEVFTKNPDHATILKTAIPLTESIMILDYWPFK
jgi:hypothetical protein